MFKNLISNFRKLWVLLNSINDIKTNKEGNTIIEFKKSVAIRIEDHLVIDTDKYCIINSKQLHLNPLLPNELKAILKNQDLTNRKISDFIKRSETEGKRLMIENIRKNESLNCLDNNKTSAK